MRNFVLCAGHFEQLGQQMQEATVSLACNQHGVITRTYKVLVLKPLRESPVLTLRRRQTALREQTCFIPSNLWIMVGLASVPVLKTWRRDQKSGSLVFRPTTLSPYLLSYPFHNIKIDVGEMGYKNVKWSELAKNYASGGHTSMF